MCETKVDGKSLKNVGEILGEKSKERIAERYGKRVGKVSFKDW